MEKTWINYHLDDFPLPPVAFQHSPRSDSIIFHPNVIAFQWKKSMNIFSPGIPWIYASSIRSSFNSRNLQIFLGYRNWTLQKWYFKVHGPPPVISWFINPINWFVISTKNHSFFATTSQLKAIFGAPSCISVFLQIFLGAISRSKENAPGDTTLTHIHRAGRRILRLESGWKICVGHFHCPFTPSLDIIGNILYLWTLVISYIWIETSGLCV